MQQRYMHFVRVLGILAGVVACTNNAQRITLLDNDTTAPFNATIAQAINAEIAKDNKKYPDFGNMPTVRPSQFLMQEKDVVEQDLLRQRATLRSTISTAQESARATRMRPTIEATDSTKTPMALPMVAKALAKKAEQDRQKGHSRDKTIPSLGGQPPKNQRE